MIVRTGLPTERAPSSNSEPNSWARRTRGSGQAVELGLSLQALLSLSGEIEMERSMNLHETLILPTPDRGRIMDAPRSDP